MKRFVILLLSSLLVISLAACNNQAETQATVTTTAALTTTTITTVNPYSKSDDMVAAYNAMCTTLDVDYPITNILFKDGTGCYIVTENQHVYTFFAEGATELSLVYESAKFTLHYAPSMADVMVQAMQNAWNEYADKCAEDRAAVYDQQLYLFECDYFDGVFGLDANNQLKQNLVREGINCGTFGPFTIYVPENADQSQQGNMTDGEITVLIKNAYNKFAAQTALDADTCEPIEYYIFELNGEYFQVSDSLERLDSSAVSGLAMDAVFDGWRVYLPVLDDVMPQYDIFQAAYAAFVQEASDNNKKYSEITAYAFAYQDAYYGVDEWNNVLTVDESRIGKKASETDFDGIFIYKIK